MRTLYVDAFAGISGDMTVGAFLALGLPLDHLRAALEQVALAGYTISAETRHVNGIVATKFDVHLNSHGHAHRAYREIRALLEPSRLDEVARRHALAIFSKLAEAEARVHGIAPDEVEFHEV